MAKVKRRGIFFTRRRIPGVRGEGEDELLQSRTVGRVAREKIRARRRLGARTRSQVAEDATLRGYGVNVFDRNAGISELSGYLAPRE